MASQWTPMRWPATWKDPSALSLLKSTPINYLFFEKGEDFAPLRARAQEMGLHVADLDAPPSGITIVKGEWPGVRMSRGPGAATAGPTGVPWVDSNGWKVRLTAAMKPDAVWVNALPRETPRVFADSYMIAIADAAAYGGRWIISLDKGLTAAVAEQKPEGLAAWHKIVASADFFASHKGWVDYAPEAVFGVVSDFSGKNEFFSSEVLNLLARAGAHYRIVRKDHATATSFQDLKAVIYTDAEPPAQALKESIVAFVRAGGLLITGPKWGAIAGAPARDEHPRFSTSVVGKGKAAVARADPNDPYLFANDSVVLLSHRYDLVRFWNGGATGSYYTMAPDRKRAVVHLLFYSNRGPDAASVRVVGKFRSARATTVEAPEPREVGMISQKDAVEVHLPAVPQYVALELES